MSKYLSKEIKDTYNQIQVPTHRLEEALRHTMNNGGTIKKHKKNRKPMMLVAMMAVILLSSVVFTNQSIA
ncbi:hypothetical protein ACFSCX_15455, partial [Bacillus salitolerans]